MSEQSIVAIAVAGLAALSPVLVELVKRSRARRAAIAVAADPKGTAQPGSKPARWLLRLGGPLVEGVGVWFALSIFWAWSRSAAHEADVELALGREQVAAAHELASRLFELAYACSVAWFCFHAARDIAGSLARIEQAQLLADEARAIAEETRQIRNATHEKQQEYIRVLRQNVDTCLALERRITEVPELDDEGRRLLASVRDLLRQSQARHEELTGSRYESDAAGGTQPDDDEPRVNVEKGRGTKQPAGGGKPSPRRSKRRH